MLAPLGERMGDALRGLVDLLADQVADGGQILGQVDVDVVDGRAHLLGLADQRVALVGEVLQQAADADFVVAIGALERGDFVLHQGFELAGAGQCPLDAVAHGRDFAADRLADGDDGIPRHALGLGEPQRDLRHRLRDQAQFLGAPGHMRDAEEEDDGQQRRGAKADHGGGWRMARAERRVEIGQIGPRQRQAADDPGGGEQGGDVIRGPGRTVLQRAQDAADRLLVVIGGAKRLRLGGAMVAVSWLRLSWPRVSWPRVSMSSRSMASSKAGVAGSVCGKASTEPASGISWSSGGGACCSSSSLTLRASWIAERAASVGSINFFG